MQRAHQINTSNEEDMREREYAKKTRLSMLLKPCQQTNCRPNVKKFRLTVNTKVKVAKWPSTLAN